MPGIDGCATSPSTSSTRAVVFHRDAHREVDRREGLAFAGQRARHHDKVAVLHAFVALTASALRMIGRLITRNSSAICEVGASGVTKPCVRKRSRSISSEADRRRLGARRRRRRPRGDRFRAVRPARRIDAAAMRAPPVPPSAWTIASGVGALPLVRSALPVVGNPVAATRHRRGAVPRGACAACSIRLIERSFMRPARSTGRGRAPRRTRPSGCRGRPQTDRRCDAERGSSDRSAASTPCRGSDASTPRAANGASWKIGMIWLATKARGNADRQRREQTRRRAARSGVGATGSGDTRGGSMTRNRAPPESCTSLPIVADSRRASSDS